MKTNIPNTVSHANNNLPNSDIQHPFLGASVLVRAKNAGVHYGTLEGYGEFVYLTQSRRVWSWEGALSCSEVSQVGPTKAKLGQRVPHLTIPTLDVGEVLLMDPVAVDKLDGIKDGQD